MPMMDTEDEDLKAAIAMSLSEKSNKPPVATPPDTVATGEQESKSVPDAMPFAGLDRRAMEAERLARLNRKRERSISPPALSSRKAPKLEANTVSLPSGAKLTSFSSLVNQGQRDRKSEIANQANQQLRVASETIKQEGQDHVRSKENLKPETSSAASIKYPTGVVKGTWAYGFERSNDIKLEEVLEPRTLRTAVLSAFQWDIDWVLSKLKTPLNGGSTKCVFIMQAEKDELRKEMLQQTEGMRKFLRLNFPPMYAPIHCMHSKLMLLFHENKLRVAIPTANLLNFDWGETGVMENSCFLIDLPRLSQGSKHEQELSAFGEELLYFLNMQGVDQDVRDGVRNFDFSATKGMMFIHTSGGTHYGESAERTGLPGLARAVRKLNLTSQDALEIDFAASSIGSLNDEYLKNVHAAARGLDMIQRATTANTKAREDFFKSAAKSPSESMGIRDKIRIYFPMHQTVTSSIAGSAGTICLNRKWFESATFPRTSFRDYRSTRPGMLSHNKILYARGKHSVDKNKDVAWAYVGSANMSESAWGKLVFDKKEKAWKLSCRNWECGVLLPVLHEGLTSHDDASKSQAQASFNQEEMEGEDSETEDEGEYPSSTYDPASSDVVDIDVFNTIVKPPFEIPGARYGSQQPWYFTERNT